MPEEFVVNIKEENAKILDITGGKGNSLALLACLESEEVSYFLIMHAENMKKYSYYFSSLCQMDSS